MSYRPTHTAEVQAIIAPIGPSGAGCTGFRRKGYRGKLKSAIVGASIIPQTRRTRSQASLNHTSPLEQGVAHIVETTGFQLFIKEETTIRSS
jgi:hypothetical protein